MPKEVNSLRDEYQEDDDDDNYSTRKNKKKQAPPRFIKNTIEDVNPEQIVVNLSKTHYDIIETVVEELGWVVERSKKSQSWDIMWTDWHIDAQDLFKLNDQQKISHFPAIYVLAKKNFLGRGLMKMSKVFPQQYNYFPNTWSVPSQISELLRYDSQIPEQSKPIYIFKPQASCQGKGISLFSNLEDIEGKTGIVQLYVNNPLLIDNLKFDMRIYVLIYGCDPVRIYIYQEGLARFATQNYQKAGKKNLKDNYIHLTNYAINKNNKKFVFNTSQSHMNVGHKRSLTSVYNLLAKKGYNVAQIKMKIDKMIVKTLLVGKPMLQHMYGLSQTTNLAKDHCFQILGFDVLINENLEPILLQVNHTPSFVTDTPLDKNIKKNLIKETFLLLNVNLKTKMERIQKKLQFQEKRSQRKLTKMTAQQKMEQKRIIEKQKDQYESSTLKRYRKIYPVESNEYKDMEECAYKIFNEQSGFKNKQIVSSLKNSVQVRPNSLENIPTTKKLKKKGEQRQKSALDKYPSPTTRYNLEEKIEKLPDISPKRSSFFKSSTIVSPKMLLKNYQFSPEKVFAHITQKYAKRYKHYYNKIPQSSGNIIAEKEKNIDKKQGGFVEQKFIKLTEITSKNLPFHGQISDYAVNLQKSQKNTRKTFLDFIAMNHKQKNVLQARAESELLKKQQKMTKQDFRNKANKIQIGFSQTFTIDEAFSLKSRTLAKEKPLNQ